LAQSQVPENVASAGSHIENAECVCGCNPQPIDDSAFWEELNALLIQMVCLVERQKLHSTYTTSELRKVGKATLCKAGRI